MGMTGEEFATLYERVDTPHVPQNWSDELYQDMLKLDPLERAAREQDNPIPSKVRAEDVIKAWKMLCSLDWFRDGVERGRNREQGGIAEDVWGSTRGLLYWWSLKSGLNTITVDKYLSNDSSSILIATAYPSAIEQCIGKPIEEIFDKYLLESLKLYRIIGFEND